jgi:hypothetical protein
MAVGKRCATANAAAARKGAARLNQAVGDGSLAKCVEPNQFFGPKHNTEPSPRLI